MAVTSALILLAQAATALTPAQAPRLSAGVKVERAVASSEVPPFELLGAAIVVRKNLLSTPTQPIS